MLGRVQARRGGAICLIDRMWSHKKGAALRAGRAAGRPERPERRSGRRCFVVAVGAAFGALCIGEPDGAKWRKRERERK